MTLSWPPQTESDASTLARLYSLSADGKNSYTLVDLRFAIAPRFPSPARIWHKLPTIKNSVKKDDFVDP